MPTLTLITGGIRSGKSAYALELARERHAGQKCFIATAEALDEEMRLKIARHQAERGADFSTVEEPLHLSEAVRRAQAECVLIDCLTLWTSNLLYKLEAEPSRIDGEIENFLRALEARQRDIVIVTNEVGFGLIGDNVLSRKFVNLLGSLNRRVAERADEVILMISGIPTRVKGEGVARLDR